MLFILANVWKQGISEYDLLISARGKEFYSWDEIHHVKITRSDKAEIVYYTASDLQITTQYSSADKLDAIMAILKKHNISVTIN